MKAFINKKRFLKAVAYASANLFSKPYSLSPVVDRWFNQLAMIGLEDGTLLHLTGQLAIDHLQITVDGKTITREELGLIFKFHSQHAKYDAERQEIEVRKNEVDKEVTQLRDHIKEFEEYISTLEQDIPQLKKKIKEYKNDEDDLDKTFELIAHEEELADKLKQLPQRKKELTQLKKELAQQERALEKQTELLAAFDTQKAKAQELYDAIVERGEAKLDEKSLEKKYQSRIKHIVYRPNHGLTHSVRAAYMVTAIQAFEQEHAAAKEALKDNDTELEKLQMMMLFSVVGRRDETGFNDSNAQGRATYASFRTASGKEYLKYCQTELKDIYQDNLEELYRDAIIVELMGYDSIEDCLSRRKEPPELFIDYVMAKEKNQKEDGKDITRQDALTAITEGKYALKNLFSDYSVRKLADAKLHMMNKAHAIDLVRCYPLYSQTPGGAKSLGIINTYLLQSRFMDNDASATVENLESAYKMMRCCFDAMAITGQHTTFGLLSQAEFDARKTKIIEAVKAINDRCKPENRETLIKEMRASEAEMKNYFNLYQNDEAFLLDRYFMLLILKETAKHLTHDVPHLNSDKKMFDFQHSQPGNPHVINHEQNASSLVQALQDITPVKGVNPFPVISSVKHDRAQNQVTLFFDDEEMAEFFVEHYANYHTEKLDITENPEDQFSVVIDRAHYFKLLHDKQIEFKQVTIPHKVNREDSLITESGRIEALDLVANSRALVRLVSTTPLSGETFPDYDYLLKAMDDPVHERYTSPVRESHHFPANKATYYDPRTGDLHQRKISTEPLPELRFQEPVLEPKRFADQVQDGLTVGNKSQPRNTIFTKKLAHTLLPPHGKIKSFPGYMHKRSNYFPIGVLSDVQEVDLKSERYVWSQNMVTAQKYWIRDTRIYDENIFMLLHVKYDWKGNTVRNEKGILLHDASKLIIYPSPDELISHLETRTATLRSWLDEIHYRPTEKNLNDFKMLLQQERDEYLKHFKWKDLKTTGESAEKRCREIYSALEERINNEAARNHPKYSMTLKQLVEHQKKSDKAEGHNEILAGNTKGAVRALYATQDALFDRLNLAFHALQIKKQYHYDVPLLITSQDKPPYHYTEDKIKADLQEAYRLLRAGKFPYDKSLNPIYELDAQGNMMFKNGQPIIKKTADGRPVQEPKNLQYQKNLLKNLFQLGLPEITDIRQLIHGQVNRKRLDGNEIDTAIDSIVEQMDVIGSLNRETKLKDAIFEEDDEEKKEAFFLRTAALGHVTLIQKMLEEEIFDLLILEKAIQFAEQNNHPQIKKELITHLSKTLRLDDIIDDLALDMAPADRIEAAQKVRELISEIYKEYEEEYKTKDTQPFFPHFEQLIANTISELLLSPLSKNEENKKNIRQFSKLLTKYPQYAKQYSQILANEQEVNIAILLHAHKSLGVETVAQGMAEIAAYGWDFGNRFLVLQEYSAIHSDIERLKLPVDNKLTAEERIEIEIERLSFLFTLHNNQQLIMKNPIYSVIKGRGDIISINTGLQQITREIVLNPASQSSQNKAHAFQFMKLIEQHPEYVKAYAKVLVSGQNVTLDQLIEAHNRFPSPINLEIVANAMNLAASRGWEDANNYMLLHEFNMPLVATDYFAAKDAQKGKEMLQGTNLQNMTDLCSELIDAIEQQGMGPDDTATRDYCEFMRELIKQNEDQSNFLLLASTLPKLQEVYRAVTSPEMQAVKEQIARLEKNAQSIFSFGNGEKAKRIKAAVANVPLAERGTVFSKEDPAGNQVQIALASHRLSWTNPVVTINKKVKIDGAKAANSFKEIKEKLQQQKQTEEEVPPTKHM